MIYYFLDESFRSARNFFENKNCNFILFPMILMNEV